MTNLFINLYDLYKFINLNRINHSQIIRVKEKKKKELIIYNYVYAAASKILLRKSIRIT